jgi:hypothetical protein
MFFKNNLFCSQIWLNVLVVDCHFLEQHEKIEKENTDSDITTMPIFHNKSASTKWMTFI